MRFWLRCTGMSRKEAGQIRILGLLQGRGERDRSEIEKKKTKKKKRSERIFLPVCI